MAHKDRKVMPALKVSKVFKVRKVWTDPKV
jgi:hypothetical protein